MIIIIKKLWWRVLSSLCLVFFGVVVVVLGIICPLLAIKLIIDYCERVLKNLERYSHD